MGQIMSHDAKPDNSESRAPTIQGRVIHLVVTAQGSEGRLITS